MRKIIMSFLAIALTVGMVSGAAYAVFSSNVNVSGITISTGNAQLQASDNSTTGFTSGPINMTSLSLTGLFPAEHRSFDFYLRNSSNSNISLDLAGRLTSAGGDWELLSPKLWLKIDNSANPSETTGWQTLVTWNAGNITLPGGPLAQNGVRQFTATLAVDNGAGNEIAGKSITDINFVLIGTQH